MIISSDAEIIMDEAIEAISEITTLEDRNRSKSITPAFKDAADVPDSYHEPNLCKGLVDLMISHLEKGDCVITISQAVNTILQNYYSSKRFQRTHN